MSDQPKPLRAAQTFSSEEVAWMEQLFAKLRNGSTVDRVMLRSQAGANVMRKVRAMHDRVTFLRAGGAEDSD